MLLLTESAVNTRKYLLWLHAVRTERSEVCAAWHYNKYFPYGPNSRLIRALLYTYTTKTTESQCFPLLLWTEVQLVHTPVRTQAYGPALSQSDFSIQKSKYSILDAKLESSSSSSFGDMTLPNFPWKKRTNHQVGVFTPWKKLLRNEFLCPESFFLTQNWPHVNFRNFQAEENLFLTFWDAPMRKRQQQTPWLINFAKIWSKHVLRVKTKGHRVWAS